MKVKETSRSFVIPQFEILNKSIKKKKMETGRRLSASAVPNPTKTNFQVVPWSSTAQWDSVCQLFSENDYDEVMERLLVWRARVPTLPVGVEGTMFLIQALEFDAKCNQYNPHEELHARSLYSLALIRFVNHVSHLATQVTGGAAVPMFQLASRVSIPNWMVEMRHEATHGGNLPSLEPLRLAADFMKTWLHENYWIGSGSNAKISVGILSIPDASIQSADGGDENGDVDEGPLFQRACEVISAYVASRVYHLRQAVTITDSEVTKFWPHSPSSISTKEALRGLKQAINHFLAKDSVVTCAALAGEMIPPPEFYKEFCSVFPIKPITKLRLVWSPILKLIQRKRALGRVCAEFAKIHTATTTSEKSAPATISQRLSALWIKTILRMMKEGNVNYSEELYSEILPVTMKSPNSYSHLFLKRLLLLLKPKVGRAQLEKLKLLAEIWTEPSSGDEEDVTRIGRKSGKHLITVEEIVSSYQNQSDKTTFDIHMTPELDTLHPRGSDFWESIPLGHVFSSLS